MIVRVSAASRLHFGLLSVPVAGASDPSSTTNQRKFGGLGLMLDAPRIVVEAKEANDWHFAGSLAERAKRFVEKMALTRPLSLTANGPPEHVGLGVGTALGMAIAETISVFDGARNRSSRELAALCGRGERSGIGVSGFRMGGFIVDTGKRDGELTSHCQSIAFPDDWRIVVARPRVVSKWSGDAERAAFARPRSADESRDTSHRLERLMHDSIVPALNHGDFTAFANALTEYNRCSGEPFIADQGGEYSSPDVAKLIAKIQSFGVSAVGQSSWGPSVFAVVDSEKTAESMVNRLNDVGLGMELDSVTVSKAAKPAAIEVIN